MSLEIRPAQAFGPDDLAANADGHRQSRQILRGETRTVLRFHPRLAPYKVAVLPLSKKPELSGVAREVLGLVQPNWMTDYDETQAIGRRYRRQDELGTPFCVTVDFDSLDDRAVTVRERDSMQQERVPIDGLVDHLRTRLAF